MTPSSGEGKLTVPGTGTYTLTHCVVRMPSEHTVNHNQYALEVQCHHTMDGTEEKRKGILSTLYEVSSPSSFIAQLETQMPQNATTALAVKSFSFGGAIGTAGQTRYHSYSGSQTTGDCKEDVDWYIMYDPTGVSQSQLDKLQANMNTTWKPARHLQKPYGRHPLACHHPHEDGAATAGLGFLSFALVLFSSNSLM